MPRAAASRSSKLIVVMTGVAMMLGLCAITLQLLMQLNADGQARLSAASGPGAAGAAASRRRPCLPRRLDSPLTHRGSGQAGGPASDHRSPIMPLSYEVRDGSVVRVESRAGKPIRHESYSLPRGRVARFELRNEAAHRLVALVVTQVAGKSRTDPPSAARGRGLAGQGPAGRSETGRPNHDDRQPHGGRAAV